MNSLPPYVLAAERRSFTPFSATGTDSRDHINQMQKCYEDSQTDDELTAEFFGQRGAKVPLPGLPTPGAPLDGDGGEEEEEVEGVNNHTGMTWVTLGLARYARRQMRLGVLPTDAMFQDEARRLIYGSHDAWEQTIADNEEWLTNFRMEVVDRNMSQV
jgi:hypothetical protein